MKKVSVFSDRRTTFLVSLVLVMMTTAAYWRTFHNGFVLYDDRGYVTENPHVQQGLTWEQMRWALAATYAANWHPLTWMSHMLDCHLFGLNPAGHHGISLLLHLANTALLFFVLAEMTGALWRSAFVAALFALHPMHVESVAWVAERKDVLSGFFWMLTLWAYLRWVKDRKPANYALLAGTFAFGLMAKPMLVTLPFVLLLLDYWPLKRFNVTRTTSRPGKRNEPAGRLTGEPPAKLIWEKLPLLALVAASSVLTFYAQHRGGAVQTLEILPLQARLANAVVSYDSYVAKLLWPHDLAVFYPHPLNTLPYWKISGALLLLAAATWLVIRYRGHGYVSVGWFWYLGTLVPVIGVVQVGDQAMADRYSYIPSIGLFVIVSWGLPELLPQGFQRRIALSALGGAVISVLAILTWIQVGYWHDSLKLFEHAAEAVPNNYLAHNAVGFALANQGKWDQATEHYLKALWVKPTYAEAHNNLGNAFAAKGEWNSAIPHYEKALRLKRNLFQAENNLGVALFATGRWREAVEHSLESLRLNPDQPELHNSLGMKLAALGRLDEAISHFSEALHLRPDNAQYHYNLGLVLAARGRTAEAIENYREALRLKPDYPEAHVNLGVALAQQGKINEALDQYSRALQIKSDYPDAHINMGIELAEQGRLNDALRHFAEAARIKPDSAEAHFNLARIYLSLGNQSAALSEYATLKKLNPRMANDLASLLNH
ncbi:MAG TPA: tetratricopeptide repeat protein [Acidobacteriota bacterium]|jgi:tetratricopeptide (TPR) repeat protein|nr:tetratricopeptide repeat protein [Acidobacteriota bacterium]